MLAALLASLISLAVSPTQCFEPCEVKLTIRLTEPEQTREVCIHLDGDGLERHSCWPPQTKTNETRIGNIPAGAYAIWASGIMAGGKPIETPRRALIVLGERDWRRDDGF